ncbi:cell division protein FtsQ/DivIB [Fructilactobacillus fructivorans]|uniref:cell division protein FtsQ/DivIB n=1 Tax=Fructilactobacillus fructivorans TaxID=1614 RepID=UPI00070AD782|nr:cell division protein FtsQ/DivIB [Fructilactobacillus fructivorans]
MKTNGNDSNSSGRLERYQERKQRKNSRYRVGHQIPGIRRQQRRQLIKGFLPILLAFSIIALISLYFVLPYSRISEIKVQTDRQLADANINKQIPFQAGDSLFMVKRNQSKAQQYVLNHNAEVKKIDFVFTHHNQLNVKVMGYSDPEYALRNGKYYPVYPSGNISNQAVKIKKLDDVCVLSGFNQKEEIKNVLKQYKNIKPPIRNQIKELQSATTKSNPERIKIVMKDGNEVYVKTSTMAEKMAYYPSIAKTLKQKSVINMEVGAYSYPLGK